MAALDGLQEDVASCLALCALQMNVVLSTPEDRCVRYNNQLQWILPTEHAMIAGGVAIAALCVGKHDPIYAVSHPVWWTTLNLRWHSYSGLLEYMTPCSHAK